MADFTISTIAVPRSDSFAPSWVMRQSDELRRRDALETLGSDDFFTPLASGVHGMRRQVDRWRVALVAVEGQAAAELSWEAERAPHPGTVLGVAGISGGLNDNQNVAELGVIVAEPARRQGVGTALLAACERVARQKGCTTVQGWAEHRSPGENEDALTPPTGAGRVPYDAAAGFALARGYRLEQCEQHSVCALPGDAGKLAELRADALPHAAGYQLHSFVGPVPDELVCGYAQLLEHFSAEVPSGGLETEPECWDADRIRRGEAARAAAGREAVTTLAIHEATGAVVASTDITTDPVHPEVCFQQVTVVDRAHRGHRLGLLVKLANHQALAEHRPRLRRVHTWNADENDWMRSINRDLGFQPGLTEGAWQKRL
ncbi:GNAT family N-acetyltransferase [Luteococcus sp. Sow4_B9]|uniref:GNAT family N-acetyltransferase n=1 Tax=Luteococcus sp. Sow4_B9 TaxID=3438792 RepID=UPI003F95B3EA